MSPNSFCTGDPYEKCSWHPGYRKQATRTHTRHALDHRQHTAPIEGGVAAAGERNAWDTVKPLSKWFRRLDRIVLFDDDAHKACPGEEANMVRVPCWDDSNEGCELLKELVETVMKVIPLQPACLDGWIQALQFLIPCSHSAVPGPAFRQRRGHSVDHWRDHCPPDEEYPVARGAC